jgi:hypothetical protein
MAASDTPGFESRVRLLACATVLEEMRPILPEDVDVEMFDFGRHLHPEGLRGELQDAVNRAGAECDTVLLGYGLCSMAVVGLEANECTLVVPRVDDCIAAFLGSQGEYRKRSREEPGTYYLTKGWIEASDTLLDEYNRMVDSYGGARAERMMSLMLRHYQRLIYIDTGHPEQGSHKEQARAIADHFDLEYQEIPGSNRLLRKLLNGPWDDEFVVAAPGSTIRYTDFKTTATAAANLTIGGVAR